MRKNLKIILLLLTIMMTMCMFVGCGDGVQDDAASLPESDNQSSEQLSDTTDTDNDEDLGSDERQGNNTKDKQGDTPDTSAGGSDELCVFVESIGDNSVVGNIISMEPSADGNDIVVMIGEGGGNKKLVSIYFADDASYVYQIIRNSNVETREGSFSDIGIDMILDLTGYYKGEDFYADKVAISDVRDN